MSKNTSTISWITAWLTDMPQYMRLGTGLSDLVMCRTGAPQGTFLSLFLFACTPQAFSTSQCHSTYRNTFNVLEE